MKELNTYLNEAARRGIKVIVVRMANEFQNKHEVPELTLKAMRNRFCDYPGEIIVKNNSLD
jgi:tRNA splicing ligase